ncbi:MAG: Stp1/IreP family PP2C-type Ser/Thr phosphatase, partial [Acidimicrobiales bacterium]
MTEVRWGVATDVGRVRTTNQDRALAAATLFAVADGMGGHQGGEVAAELAVRTLGDRFFQDPTESGLREAVRAANAAVWERGQADAALRGMGTTLTAVAVVGDPPEERLELVNVGDSRTYLLRGDRLLQLTNDHSLVEEMVRNGEISPAEAAVHPGRHILTRAIGERPDVDIDAWLLVPATGDRLLLCSDGLINEVQDREMAELVRRSRDPQGASEALVARATDNGGSDNITVVVVEVVDGARPGRESTSRSDSRPMLLEAVTGGNEAAGPGGPTLGGVSPGGREAGGAEAVGRGSGPADADAVG